MLSRSKIQVSTCASDGLCVSASGKGAAWRKALGRLSGRFGRSSTGGLRKDTLKRLRSRNVVSKACPGLEARRGETASVDITLPLVDLDREAWTRGNLLRWLQGAEDARSDVCSREKHRIPRKCSLPTHGLELGLPKWIVRPVV
ncbi:hypothetical protein CHELA20_54386 [Hyphomicrobiales bacterium]|nr:hypothetical protein CHELA41_20542 [Hyphomicrobiales bacterium]CAH1686160.1 hypothetical protein CHELA20_54386 [Hyphomicrobiales bacterium]